MIKKILFILLSLFLLFQCLGKKSDELLYLISTGNAISNADNTETSNGALISVANGTTEYSNGSTLDVGASDIGSALPPVTLTIANTGNADLNLTASPFIAISGDQATDFSISQPVSGLITAGSSIDFSIVFTPSAAGSRTALLTIASDDNSNPSFQISLQGTGNETTAPNEFPTIEVYDPQGNLLTSGSSYDFGNITSMDYTTSFTIKNNSTDTLTLTNSSTPVVITDISGKHSVATQPSATSLSALATTSFSIKATTSVTGIFSDTLSIASNDSNTPNFTLTLSIVSIIDCSGFSQTSGRADKLWIQSGGGKDGNLGGISGADSSCTTLAANNGLSHRTFKALLMDSSSRSDINSNWVLTTDTRYFLLSSFKCLFKTDSGSAKFSFGSSESPLPGGADSIWTGIANDWSLDQHCSNWTSNSSSLTGATGSGGAQTVELIHSSNTETCNAKKKIICVEQ